MTQTGNEFSGNELINHIAESAETFGKIFIQDSFDEAIANSIVNFAKRQDSDWTMILIDAVSEYIQTSSFTVNVKEFGNKVPDIFQRIKTNYAAKVEFDNLVRQTQERMKGS